MIVEKRATLQEIETHWSIKDLVEGNEALDLWHEEQAKAAKKE